MKSAKLWKLLRSRLIDKLFLLSTVFLAMLIVAQSPSEEIRREPLAAGP